MFAQEIFFGVVYVNSDYNLRFDLRLHGFDFAVLCAVECTAMFQMIL